MSTTTLTPGAEGAATRAPWMRPAWIVAGGIALAGAGVAAGLAWRPAPSDAAQAVPTAPTAATLASRHEGPAPDDGERPAVVPAPQPEAPAPAKPSKVASAKGSSTSAKAASVCATCGVVESVREVKVKGEGTGLGAIAGGVLGGAVGNQVGGGNGRKAMTVIGAVGGGLAGHEIEKRARAETFYDVTVRMDDGSVKTLRKKSAPAAGSRVTVEGTTLRVTKASA